MAQIVSGAITLLGTLLVAAAASAFAQELTGPSASVVSLAATTTVATFNGTNGRNPYGGLVRGSDGNFYGTTEFGGTSDLGTVFQITPGGTITTLVNFSGSNGALPRAGLVLGNDGNFYGTTSGGGTSDQGTVFRVTPAGVLTTIASFSGSNGYAPFSEVVIHTDGNFYGVTRDGGQFGRGNVYRVTPQGAITSLHDFSGSDGALAFTLIVGADGNFYGTTSSGGTSWLGGTSGCGTVFKITSTGTFTTLWNFSCTDGQYPQGKLVYGADGNYYGTTARGGSSNLGTAFRLSPAGSFTSLVSFTGAANGSTPRAVLLQLSDGNFYSTTFDGGSHNAGTVYRMTPAGAITTLVNFPDPSGNGPWGELVAGDNDVLYGTTTAGGPYGFSGGVVYSMPSPLPPPAAFAKLAPLNGGTAQAVPPTLMWSASAGAKTYEYCVDTTNDNACSNWTSVGSATTATLPVAASNSSYYWQVRATSGSGSTYADGSASAYYNFTTGGGYAATLVLPTPGVTLPGTSVAFAWDAAAGATQYWLYVGTTGVGSSDVWNEDMGLVRVRQVTGLPYSGQWVYVRLWTKLAGGWSYYDYVYLAANLPPPPGSFTKSAPANGAVSQTNPPTLTWTTSTGAAAYEYCVDATNDNACSDWISVGTSTSVTVQGLAPTTMYYWHVRATNGTGTTYADASATAFRNFTTNAGAVVATFNGTGGAYPYGALVKGTDGNLYGTTNQGGSSDLGTVFRLTPDGTLTTLVSFNGSNGRNPRGGLVLAADGNFYGTTAYGGSSDVGTLFRITPAGTLTTVVSFTGPDGGTPYSGLVIGADGNLYGTTLYGGALGRGTVFKSTLGGVLTTLYSFSGTDGANPYSLMLGTDGNFYGTTTAGGSTWTGAQLSGSGTVFRITPAGAFTSLASFVGSNGEYPHGRLVAGLDGNYYGTTAAGGTAGLGTVYRLQPNGTLTTLLSFTGANGSTPHGGLVALADSSLYGTTYAGGSSSHGTVFKMTLGGTLTTLLTFTGANGDSPFTDLLAADGRLYGTTVFGGPNGKGTVFYINDPAIPFVKSAPANATTGQTNAPTLYWAGSSQATGYQYCLDTTNNAACDTGWVSTGLSTSVQLSGLTPGSTYFWQVRATGPTGTTYANGAASTYWSFSVGSFPGVFGKGSPSSGMGVSSSPTLQWTASAAASSYEYCVDTTNDNACSNWVSVGSATSVTLNGLAANTTYYWQVRAINGGGTTHANGSAAAFWSMSTGAPLTQNGDFSNGITGWTTFGAPDTSYMESTISSGTYAWRRIAQTQGQPVSQATIYQESGMALAPNVPVSASFQLGNSSSTRKYVKVLFVGDPSFSDLAACTFWLAPNTPLTTYQMRAHTTKAWSNATIYFYASSPKTDNGYYLLDNVSMQFGGNQAVDRTECVDPNVPAPPGGSAGANLLTNGDFGTGALTPWGTVGSITSQIAGNVLEFYRGAVFPPPVILQATGQAMTSGQLLTATFRLGNSSPVRKRVLVLLNDADFSDLTACTFWLEPYTPLAAYQMVGWTSKAWANASVSIYPSTQYDAGTPSNNAWIRLDDVTLQRTPAATTPGTSCIEPALSRPAGGAATAAMVDPSGQSPASLPSAVAGGPVHLVRTTAGAAPVGAATPADAEAPWIATGSVLSNERGPDGHAVWSISGLGNRTATLEFAGRLVPGDGAATFTLWSRTSSHGAQAAVEVKVDEGGWMRVIDLPADNDWRLTDVDLSMWAAHEVAVRVQVDGEFGEGDEVLVSLAR